MMLKTLRKECSMTGAQTRGVRTPAENVQTFEEKIRPNRGHGEIGYTAKQVVSQLGLLMGAPPGCC